MMPQIFANLELEAAVVFAVCGVFMILFVVAGVRQAIKDRDG